MTLTVTDLFCGAGGSSSGAEQVPGVRVRMAANHWSLAVETHNTNLPHADHDCADISQVDPRRYPATDLLWASPECTNHSQAKGIRKRDQQPDLFGEVLPDAAAERSRATMWDVPRFVEAMQLRGRPYKAFVVENVVDVRDWMYYRAWRMALTDAGYCLHEVFLNSMHAQGMGMPAPQSRDRWYCGGHLSTTRCPDLEKWTRPAAWCPTCERMVRAIQSWKNPRRQWGRYRAQYVYRCPSSTCRHQVVEPAWLPAAAAIDWSLPGERIGDRKRPLATKTRARIEAGLRRYGRPVHLEAAGNTYERPGYYRVWPADEAFKTFHTTPSKGVAYPPFVTVHRGGPGEIRTSSIDGTLGAVWASGNHSGLVVPVEGRSGKNATPTGEVLRTQTARNETGVAVPPMLVPAGGTWNDEARPVDEPFRTRTTRDSEGIVIPLRQNNTAKTTTQPLDTVAAAGNHHALLLRNQNSRGDGQMCTPVDEPARTVMASSRQSLVTMPALVMRNNSGGAEMSTPVDEPVRTVTTAGHQSLIRWDHMIVDYNGPARAVVEPLPTQTTVEGDALASLAVDVDDCYFRMLEPHEIQLAMAFAADYVLLGNKRERVRLAGNAVTPPAARDLIAAVAESLGQEIPA
ncbi:DNA cytosine methyltransferase [Actinopolymorpha alba]|uniref:DNA cytosine methyltransferase n=1 Tax=Actinopolymorpha alba TaxID=533267 RepID=UPI00035DCFEF|nr:DNA cytosine methyltransferase [Actinopolymorpha alba]